MAQALLPAASRLIGTLSGVYRTAGAMPVARRSCLQLESFEEKRQAVRDGSAANAVELRKLAALARGEQYGKLLAQVSDGIRLGHVFSGKRERA